MEKHSKIFVAGHRGLVGQSVVKNLTSKGFSNLIVRTRSELDLCDGNKVNQFFKDEKIDYVFLCAAKVGGIVANSRYQADFLYENLAISINVIKAAADNDVKKLLNLGSSCIYPKFSKQPIVEEELLSGILEPTNEGYAVAKIAALKYCEKLNQQYGKCFISAMPTNLYGIGDNFHPENSHVIPGMLRRFHEAKINNSPEVVIWGTGMPKREFLFADDLAEGLLTLMEKYNSPEIVNVGTGVDVTILELSRIIQEVVDYKGKVVTDPSKPDGTPRKVLDVSKIKSLGWVPKHNLYEGLKITYKWALDNGVFV